MIRGARGAWLLALALIGASAATGASAQSADRAAIANTVFVGEDGRPLRLGDERGKVVVVDFWGKWCPPCMAELPSLKAMQDTLREEAGRIAYVFVSIKTDHFADDTAWLKASGLAGANYRWQKRTAAQFHAFFNRSDRHWFVPNSVVLSPAGDVAKWVRGSGTDWRVSADFIRRLTAAAQ